MRMKCGISKWTIVWLLSGTQLHIGPRLVASDSSSSTSSPKGVALRMPSSLAPAPPSSKSTSKSLAANGVAASPSTSPSPPAAVAAVAAAQDAPHDAPPSVDPAPDVQVSDGDAAKKAASNLQISQDAATAAASVQGGAASSRPAEVADDERPLSEAAEEAVEVSDEVLLERARKGRGPYLKHFEAFVRDARVQELMHDPFPPQAEKQNKDRQPFDDTDQLPFKQDYWSNSAQDEARALPGGFQGYEHGSSESRGFEGRESSRGGPQGYEPEFRGNDGPEAGEQEKHEGITESMGLECHFEPDFDYIGQDVATVEGLTDQACCELCAKKGDLCTVAVMSSGYDDPPRACWIKSRVTKSVQKRGVRACWPPNNKEAWSSSYQDM